MTTHATVLHSGLDVADLERSMAFYEMLGLVELRRLTTASGLLLVFAGSRDGEERLQLTMRPGEAPADTLKAGHVAVGVSSIDEVLAVLAASGIAAEREPYRSRPGGPMLCFVRDPDGYQVELVQDDGTA